MTDTSPFDPVLFSAAAIAPDTAALNEQMIQLLTGQPDWWIAGPEAFRAARRRGEGPFPRRRCPRVPGPSRSRARTATRSLCA